MKTPTRDELIFAECEKRKSNCAHVARKYNITRQRAHQIMHEQAKKLGRKPKFYKERPHA